MLHFFSFYKIGGRKLTQLRKLNREEMMPIIHLSMVQQSTPKNIWFGRRIARVSICAIENLE
jgi:hypothetical protein